MSKKKYVYFVAYIAIHRGNTQYGNAVATLDHKITGIETINYISAQIKKEQKLKSLPVVMNYILLREEEQDDE